MIDQVGAGGGGGLHFRTLSGVKWPRNSILVSKHIYF